MPLSDHVSINITQDTVGVKRAGFGVPLILSANAAFAERVRYYQDLPSLVTDGFATDSPEYRAVQAMLSQELRPERIAIGRAALKPTQRYEIGLAAGGIKNSHTYRLRVAGEGIAGEVDVTAASDASPLATELAPAIATALNNVVGSNYTAAPTGGTFPVVVTADNPGDWFSIELRSLDDGSAVDDLSIAQTHADPGVATDLTAIQQAQPDWYALHTLYNSEAYVLAAAAWVEANEKIYVWDSSDSQIVTTGVGSGDVLDEWFTDGYVRSLGQYHPSPANMLSAALYGDVLPLDPGSETWKWKTLVGPAPVSLTSTHRQNLLAKNGNSYQLIAGRGMTWEGQTADGGFLDRVRGRDWIKDDMAKGIYEVLLANPKVPFTDGGINMIEAPMRATLRRAVRKGILNPGTPGDPEDPEPTVSVPRAKDVPTADRARRRLPDLKWSAREAGAVHEGDIGGTVSL